MPTNDQWNPNGNNQPSAAWLAAQQQWQQQWQQQYGNPEEVASNNARYALLAARAAAPGASPDAGRARAQRLAACRLPKHRRRYGS